MGRKEKWQSLKNKLKSAVFVEIMVWLLVIVVFSFSVNLIFYNHFVRPNLYTIELKDVDGLIKGSPVRFMGLIVGHVRNLKYKPKSIEVEIVVTKKGIKLPKGSFAAVEFFGLAGSKSIEIYPPKDDLVDIGLVPKDFLRLNDMFDAYDYMGKTFASLKSFMDNLSQRTFLEVFDGVAKLTETTKAADSAIDAGQKNKENIDKKVEDIIEGQKKVENVLDKMNKSTNELNKHFKN